MNKTEKQPETPQVLEHSVSYSEFLATEGFDMSQAMKDYSDSMKEYQEQCIKNNKAIIEKIKPLVSEKYLKAIDEFLHDEEHGIYGELEIVLKPEGEWQLELNEWNHDEYWSELKGMYVSQSCGYSGDYNGTLELNISNGMFLRCTFSL